MREITLRVDHPNHPNLRLHKPTNFLSRVTDVLFTGVMRMCNTVTQLVYWLVGD